MTRCVTRSLASYVEVCRARAAERQQRARKRRIERLESARPLAHRQRQLRRLHRNVALLIEARGKAGAVAAEIERLLDESFAADEGVAL